jgi:hypothetical protein
MNLNHLIATLLDSLAIHAHKVLPVAGAAVTFTKGRAFRMDAWKEGTARVVQFGGFDLTIDQLASATGASRSH